MRRENRLGSRTAYRDVLGRGGRVTTPEFVLYHFAREGARTPRIGLRVARRIGNAVARNRVRRRLREALRSLVPRLEMCDIVIVARPPIVDVGVGELQRSLSDATARAGLLRS